jgi:hypothetical protein
MIILGDFQRTKTFITISICAILTVYTLRGVWVNHHRLEGAKWRQAILTTRGQHENWAARARSEVVRLGLRFDP